MASSWCMDIEWYLWCFVLCLLTHPISSNSGFGTFWKSVAWLQTPRGRSHVKKMIKEIHIAAMKNCEHLIFTAPCVFFVLNIGCPTSDHASYFKTQLQYLLVVFPTIPWYAVSPSFHIISTVYPIQMAIPSCKRLHRWDRHSDRCGKATAMSRSFGLNGFPHEFSTSM